jgi:hypothetical protein
MTDATVAAGSRQGRYLTAILGLYVSGRSVGIAQALYAVLSDVALRRSGHNSIGLGGYDE